MDAVLAQYNEGYAGNSNEGNAGNSNEGNAGNSNGNRMGLNNIRWTSFFKQQQTTQNKVLYFFLSL
jgi:hypothetical protein